jgi:microcystin-dependent protein
MEEHLKTSLMIRTLGYKIGITVAILIAITFCIVSFERPAYDPLPPGITLPYGGGSAPAGYLLCDGSAVSRTTYAGLFAILSTTYGVGDGSTTFNLHDLRQRFPMGKAVSGTGGTLGGTGGAIDHTHTVTPATLNSISLIGVGTGGDDTQVSSSANNPPFQVFNFVIKI